jgi:hypothetical protein
LINLPSQSGLRLNTVERFEAAFAKLNTARYEICQSFGERDTAGSRNSLEEPQMR